MSLTETSGPMTPDPFASMVETHTGVVLFFGDRAYKAKKPVTFDFVDFAHRRARQEACRREVELNRRLAPDVYLGVADVSGPDGELCDHLVVMRRLPAERRLSRLVESGVPIEAHLRSLARLLAAFHAQAERSAAIDAAGAPGEVLERWRANQRQLDELGRLPVEEALASHLQELAARYVAGRERLFEARIAAGNLCDGHGDLLADDIFCLDDGPRVLDCLEFDERLRHGDVLNDVAFLAMDLERLGFAQQAAAFLHDYQQFSADSWPASLAHFYIAYRAQIRGLVAAIRWSQGHQASAGTARRLFELSASHLESGQVRMVVVGGLPGSGKSTLADELSRVLGTVVLRSDEIRKQSVGLDVSAAANDPELYHAARSATTYDTMLVEADACLRMGESVVLDATFAEPAWRQAARAVARATASQLSELHCVAPRQLLEERVSQRAAGGDHRSDATPEVVRTLAAREEAWPEALEVDTTGPVDAVVARAFRLVAAAT